MNYYEHHIGDYDKNTSHLTACEDGMYSRMIRRYYDKEKPLPASIDEVRRLMRARTKEEKQAVVAVLAEFFSLQDDGWHNKVCDEVLEKFIAGEPEREVKKANEDNRLKRHRAERAELFKTITDAGEHAPWNIGMEQLRELANRIKSPPPATATETAPATQPATAPATLATATQTPLPIHQSPDTSSNSSSLRSEESADKSATSRKTGKKTLKTYLAECKEAGRKPLPADHPVRVYCRDAGISDDMLAVAWCVFRDDYTQTATMKNKKYVDWPDHFANAVRGCWAKLWWTDGTTVAWTSRGQQEKAVLDARAKARETVHDAA